LPCSRLASYHEDVASQDAEAVRAAGIQQEGNGVGDGSVGALGDEQAERVTPHESVQDVETAFVEVLGQVHLGSRVLSAAPSMTAAKDGCDRA